MAIGSIPQKRCNKCGQIKPATTEFFYAIKSRNNQLRNPCKDCARMVWQEFNRSDEGKAVKKQWEEDHPEKRKQYKQTQKERHPEKSQEYNERYSANHRNEQSERSRKYSEESPDKRKAHMAVKSAVRRGDLPAIKTLQCAECGKPAQDYHHWSYKLEHWLDVIPVCKSCHRKVQQ